MSHPVCHNVDHSSLTCAAAVVTGSVEADENNYEEHPAQRKLLQAVCAWELPEEGFVLSGNSMPSDDPIDDQPNGGYLDIADTEDAVDYPAQRE